MDDTKTDLAKWEGRKGDYPVDEKQTINSPSAMIELALAKGADLDKLEKLLDLQERYERNEAKKLYVDAMAKFKENPPDIEKDRHVSYQTSKGKTEYNHATLSNVTKKINSALSLQGLSAAWVTKQDEAGIHVTCKITHVAGHTEETTLTAAPDDSGGKNKIQAIGSTISYLERYTLLALTGLATNDMDNDAIGESDRIDEDQLSRLRDMIDSTGAVEELFLNYMSKSCEIKIEKLEDIPKDAFEKGMVALQESANRNRK